MIDDVFGLLADWRRRTVCRYFVTTGSNSAHVDTLAAAVARRVSDDEIEPSETCEQAIREALVHDHLPRLDEAGVLDFDARSESVCYWGIRPWRSGPSTPRPSPTGNSSVPAGVRPPFVVRGG